MNTLFAFVWAGVAHRNTIVALLLSAVTVLSACSDDDDKDLGADVNQIVGSYSVVDTDEWDEVENYSIAISKASAGGGNIEISNFADIMYVPVKATIKGGSFSIPAQTFVGKTVTITVSGSGTFLNGVIDFDYVIDSGDGYVMEYSAVATKSN